MGFRISGTMAIGSCLFSFVFFENYSLKCCYENFLTRISERRIVRPNCTWEYIVGKLES